MNPSLPPFTFTWDGIPMSTDPIRHENISNLTRGFEILGENQVVFRSMAEKLIKDESVTFEFCLTRIILTAHGPVHNRGFNLETENKDGTDRFLHGWYGYPDNPEDCIQTITTAVAILASEIESSISVN